MRFYFQFIHVPTNPHICDWIAKKVLEINKAVENGLHLTNEKYHGRYVGALNVHAIKLRNHFKETMTAIETESFSEIDFS